MPVSKHGRRRMSPVGRAGAIRGGCDRADPRAAVSGDAVPPGLRLARLSVEEGRTVRLPALQSLSSFSSIRDYYLGGTSWARTPSSDAPPGGEPAACC